MLNVTLYCQQDVLNELTRGLGSSPEGALNTMLQFIFQQSTADTRWLRRRMATELAELLAKTSSGKIFESLTVRRRLYNNKYAYVLTHHLICLVTFLPKYWNKLKYKSTAIHSQVNHFLLNHIIAFKPAIILSEKITLRHVYYRVNIGHVIDGQCIMHVA